MDHNLQTPYLEEPPASTTTGGFAHVEFAENPEPRCACILLLDTSGSMQGAPIAQLNMGLKSFKDELAADSLAAKRVEVAVLTFGDNPHLVTDFTDAENFQPPHLTAAGLTPMGAADLGRARPARLAQGTLSQQRDSLLPPLGIPDHGR